LLLGSTAPRQYCW
jgi:hypothetical protein